MNLSYWTRSYLPRVAAILFALLMCLSLGACGQENAIETDTETNTDSDAGSAWSVPDFTVINENGTAVKLSSFAGKPIVLNFWASWCPPCKAEMPDFQKAYEAHGDQVQFIIVNLTDGRQETVATATEYARGQGYTFPLYFDTTYSAANAYGVASIPRTYFIGADGALKSASTGMLTAEALEEGIQKLLS